MCIRDRYKAALEEFRKETFLFADLMGIPGPATEEEWDCIRTVSYTHLDRRSPGRGRRYHPAVNGKDCE